MITQKPIVKLYKLVMTIYKHVLFSGSQMVVEKFHGVRVIFIVLIHTFDKLLHLRITDGRFCICFYILRLHNNHLHLSISVHWSVFNIVYFVTFFLKYSLFLHLKLNRTCKNIYN